MPCRSQTKLVLKARGGPDSEGGSQAPANTLLSLAPPRGAIAAELLELTWLALASPDQEGFTKEADVSRGDRMAPRQNTILPAEPRLSKTEDSQTG